jgi:hypothetical protein
MKKSTKVWLGILTFIPPVFITIFIIWFISIFFTHIYILENNTGEFPSGFFRSMIEVFVFLILAIIIKLGLMIYYIIHLSDNPKNDNAKKIMWILILVFIGVIGSIIYYFTEIIPSSEEDSLKLENVNDKQSKRNN